MRSNRSDEAQGLAIMMFNIETLKRYILANYRYVTWLRKVYDYITSLAR
jgi:hypothetical protein